MSWLFSEAMMKAYGNSPSSLERVEEFSADTCLDGEQCAPSSVQPIQQAYCSPDKMTEFSRLSRFGMTFRPLTEDRGEELLTSYLAGFHVKPIPRRLREKTLRTISGRKCDGSWQMSLPGTYLPRTSRDVQLNGQRMTSAQWVTNRDASAFRRKTWVLTTFGSDIGFLHTPTCTANYSSPSMQKWPSCRSFVTVFGQPTPECHEWLMGWPTGWSALSPLETDKFRLWQQQHSPCWPDSREAA